MDKRRLLRSPLWELFQKTDLKKKLAKCTLCSRILSYMTTSTNLRKHLKRHGFTLQLETAGGEQKDVKTCSIWDYYTRSSEDDTMVKCNICVEAVPYEGEASLFDHLKEKHSEVEIIEAETDAESEDEPNPRGGKDNRTSPMWKYFRIVSREKRLAKCLLCSDVFSYVSSASNLKRHLRRRHHLTAKEFTRDGNHFQDTSKLKTSSISEYFSKDADDDSIKCNICSESLPDDDKLSVARHLRRKHKIVEAIDDATGGETDDGDSSSKPPRTSVAWKYFTVVDMLQRVARCSICFNDFSFLTSVSNLKKHLVRKHDIDPKRDNNIQNKSYVSKHKNSLRTCSVWDYFTKSIENDSSKCNFCEEQVEHEGEEGEEGLFDHLREKHKTVQVAPDTDTEGNENATKGHQRSSVVWKYFRVVDEEKCVARCELCAKHHSYMSTVSNLMKHLRNKHHLNFKNNQETFAKSKSEMCPIWEYFTKSTSDDSVKCNVCDETVKYESEQSLYDHLKDQHIDIQIVETDAGPEDDDWKTDESKVKTKLSRVWSHFKKTSITNKMAECKLCKMAVSFENEHNIVEHMNEKHSFDMHTSDVDDSTKYVVSASGDLFELDEGSLHDQEGNAIFIEEYKEPQPNSKKTGKRARKRKRKSGQSDSDSDSCDASKDNLNIYGNIKDASSRDESLEFFGKYMISLLRELPKNVSRKLQLDFIMQINEARSKKRKRTATNAGESSSE